MELEKALESAWSRLTPENPKHLSQCANVAAGKCLKLCLRCSLILNSGAGEVFRLIYPLLQQGLQGALLSHELPSCKKNVWPGALWVSQGTLSPRTHQREMVVDPPSLASAQCPWSHHLSRMPWLSGAVLSAPATGSCQNTQSFSGFDLRMRLGEKLLSTVELWTPRSEPYCWGVPRT